MGKFILHKDPIIEAICEFHLDAPDWDWTVPGVVYNIIKNRFPHKAESPHVDFRVDQTPDGVQPSAEVRVGRLQFWSENRTQLVQIGHQQFSVHQLKPYTGWPDFKSLIEQVLADYEQAAPFKTIRGLTLRYVNRLLLPPPPVRIEDLVRVMPQIPDSQDQRWASWFQHVEIVKPDNNAVLIVRAGHMPRQQAKEDTDSALHNAMLLDLLFAHNDAKPIERADISSWLEMAHGEIEELFFKSLTSTFLNDFEPEEN